MVGVVLIIDPDELERRRLQRAFADADLELVEAGSAIEGLFETLERDPLLILLAEQVPPLEAGELLLVLRRISGAPIIVIGGGDEPDEASALDLGADFYLRRPFGAQVAVARARALLRRCRGSLLNAALAGGGRVLSITHLMAHRRQPLSLSDLVQQSDEEGATALVAHRRLWRMPGESGLRLVTPGRAGKLPATDYAGPLRQAAS